MNKILTNLDNTFIPLKAISTYTLVLGKNEMMNIQVISDFF